MGPCHSKTLEILHPYLWQRLKSVIHLRKYPNYIILQIQLIPVNIASPLNVNSHGVLRDNDYIFPNQSPSNRNL